MTFEMAVHLTEILMAFAFIQQSLEFLSTQKHLKHVMIARILLCVLLIFGFQIPFALLGLFVIALIMLHQFQGPYNGGSDRMSLLLITGLCIIDVTPQPWNELVFGYIALQLILSYFIAGWSKIINPEWRNGRALRDVFSFSIYPVSENLRSLSNHSRLLFVGGWAVMIFELLFPLALMNQTALFITLSLAAIFHLANAFLFGFNRFVWIWIAAYPSILWLQDRIL